MKKYNITRLLALIPAVATVIMVLASCNAKKEDDPDYSPESMVAVTSFTLQSNTSVMPHLDSVFFSIDLDNGVIFNADSLPVGTKTGALVPVISFPSSVSKAQIEMTGGSHRTGVTDYKKNPSDTIDFTGRVVLTLTAEDGTTARSYQIKVNVHKTDPDSLTWDKLAVSSLPSRLSAPRAQKSVTTDDGVATIIEESDGTFTFATSADLFSARWEKRQVTLPGGTLLKTLVCDGDLFYMLDNTGRLLRTSDFDTWTEAANGWTSLIGAYGKNILGTRNTSDGRRFCSFNDSDGEQTGERADRFPSEGMTNLTLSTGKWSPHPTAFICGGRMADGSLSKGTWGYDGKTWALLANDGIPATEGSSLVAYRYFKQTTTMWVQTEFPVWMLIGGKKSDGSYNRDIYISYDNCVTWQKGSTMVQFPDFIPETAWADCIVMDTPLSASLSDAWTRKAIRRIKYNTDGYEISWQCPYIYMIGGTGADGTLHNTIWRGVLARLTFAPLI